MFDHSIITKVLSGPSYYELPDRPSDSTIGPSPQKMTQLCKKVLDEANATESPFKKCEHTSYGDCPFSQKAIEWKKLNNLTAGLNVAIIIFNLPGSEKLEYIIDNTEGGPWNKHSELKLYDQLPRSVRQIPENIRFIYSERSPCRSGSNCHRKLKTAVQTAGIISSIPHTPNKQRQQQNEAHFQKNQAKRGVRLANKKIQKKPRAFPTPLIPKDEPVNRTLFM